MTPRQVREALPSDVPALSDLMIEVQDLHVAALPHLFAPIAPDTRTHAVLRQQLALPDSQGFVATEGETLVGYC